MRPVQSKMVETASIDSHPIFRFINTGRCVLTITKATSFALIQLNNMIMFSMDKK